MRCVVPFLLFASAVCLGQQTPSVPGEQPYLRFILLNIASLDHDREAIKAFEGQLVKQFGLSAQESALLHAAGESLRPLLELNRRAGLAVAAGKRGLSPSDVATLRDIATQRELRISNLANQILNDVRPATAARLATASRIVASPSVPKK
ncbi:MAG: hypothetical protein IT168_03495 [Bryobacterales bacterium]|nr:hypothetical protein [Bryobacterales bacterium]